ncbi:MAG: hypothetical protein ACTSR3_03475 [Candidatus Helarchaeota archaeon]
MTNRNLVYSSIAIIIAVIVSIIAIYLYSEAQAEENPIFAILYIFWLY